MIRILPTFKGWTIDSRLKEFRRFHECGALLNLPFDSDEGDVLLTEYIQTLDTESPEFEEIARAVC